MAPSVRHRAKRNANLKLKEHAQQLVNLPLDVLIEIFLFLEPLDLLYLARTTKGLRAFLLNPNGSSTLWRNVINNLAGFPPCPNYMSAPAYTHLAFVPVCHGCFRPCETVEWGLRMRSCPDCFPKMTISPYNIRRIHAKIYLDGLDLPTARTHYELDYDRPTITVSLEFVKCMDSISLLDWKTVQSHKRPKEAETLKTFLAEQNEFWGSIHRHVHLCREWEYRGLQRKAARLSFVRQWRVNNIKTKLKGLGWKDADLSLFCGPKFWRLPEVGKFEPLTPTEWTEISPQVVKWMEKTKEESVYDHRMRAYQDAFFSIHDHQDPGGGTSMKLRPKLIDIAVLPAVRSVVERDIHSDISLDGLRKKFLHMLRLTIRTWSANAVEELEQLARAPLGLPPLSRPSSLPSVVFRCTVCHCRLRFDEALSHEHLYKEKRKEREDVCNASTYDKLLMRYSPSVPRDVRVLRVDVPISRRVENLIKRLGKNPNRVTYGELRRSTVNVVCGLCRPEVAIRMGFEDALKHCLTVHLGKKDAEVWARAPARE